MTDHYFTIDAEVETEYREKGSRFIGLAFPVTNVAGFKEKMKIVKDRYPKASHYCFAYRIGITGDLYRSSDDGEPSGTAGKQILGQIDSKNIIDCGIIIIRYFGGTLLGVPGLIKAYKTTAALVLQLTPVVKKNVTKKLVLQFPHDSKNVVMTIIKKYNGIVDSMDSGLFCTASFSIDVVSYPLIQEIFLNEKSIEIL